MIEISTLATTCLFLVTLILPIAILYQLWLYYRQKSATTKQSIPEVCENTFIKRLNENVTVEKKLNADIVPAGPLSLISSVHYTAKDPTRRPVDKSRPYAGEDAFFSYRPEVVSPLIGAMGIADGVGGYSDIGVDAGLMAWQLMENSRDLFADESLHQSPRDVLNRAFTTIHEKQQVVCGGTTACLVSIFQDQDEGPLLQYANLGDSGFMVVRDGEVIFRTIDQTHYFNAPYQLAIPPKGRTVIMNSPLESSSFEKCLQVREGDYIVLATDGLWDNIFDEDVVDILTLNASRYTNKVDVIERSTRELLQKSTNVSRNVPKAVLTPFQRYATDNRRHWVGGKVDDISIMIGCIVST